MEAYIGTIFGFAGTFAPMGWLMCDGSLQSISIYQELYQVIGTTYGGDGMTTFGLPDLRQKVAIGSGQGPGLSVRDMGESGGTEVVALTVDNLPAHSHAFAATSEVGTQTTPSTGSIVSALNNSNYNFYDSYNNSTYLPNLQNMNSVSVQNVGGTGSHANLMPYQTINYIICWQGSFPYNS